MRGCYHVASRLTKWYRSMEALIYLDNSATTRVRPEVLEAMLPYLSENFGNPSSIHTQGRKAREAVEQARQEVADLLGCQPREVYFSSCGTLSNNVALLGRARFVEANGLNKHLVVSRIEHPSVMGPAQYLESQGFRVTYLPVDREGVIRLEALETALRQGASMVSIMWANNEIGVLQPVEAITELVEKVAAEQGREIYQHCDAVQVIGKLPVDLEKLKLSSLSFSGHKFGAPKGIGALFLRRLVNVMPIIFGGGQEMGLMPGTEPLANIVALGVASRLARLEQEELQKRLLGYQEKLIGALLQLPGVELTGPSSAHRRLPGHVSFCAGGIEGEALVLKSDLRGMAISSGSACHQGIIEPSAVLRAIGLSPEKALGSVRITFGRDSSDADVEKACAILQKLLTGVLPGAERGG